MNVMRLAAVSKKCVQWSPGGTTLATIRMTPIREYTYADSVPITTSADIPR